jgi:hypothetical protein
MSMEKLADGVLRIMTPLGPRYLQLSLRQRIYLLWIFRHFESLPPRVLTARQRQFIDRLCAAQQYVSVGRFEDAPVIGTLESRPVAEAMPASVTVAAASAVSRFAADMRQRS